LHTLGLSHDGQERLLAGADEEELQADAEDQRDPQQRRQRGKQPPALDLREKRRRQPRVPAELDQAHLLLQPDRPDLRPDRIGLQPLSQRRRQHPTLSL